MLNKPLFKQLAWAFYLACSWTWCIGLFLPVILQKDFGNGAWLIFIICNVVGATAFSFVINSPEKSRQFLTRHNSACALFSVVTIIFQLFFVGWVISFLSSVEITWILILIAVLFAMTRYISLSVAAILLWSFSIAVMAVFITLQSGAALSEKIFDQFVAINPHAFYALPLLALGFLLCPYLDLTFHQVVQAAPTEEHHGNRLSFLIGFPVLFLTLMIFSLLYADSVEQILLNPRELFLQHTLIINALFLYFILQAAFTVLVHWQEMQKIVTHNQRHGVAIGAAIVFVLAFLSPIAVNEIGYRFFMSFYGIIAPAYLWLVAFNKKSISNNRAAIGTTLALMLSAVPLFFQNAHYYFCYPAAVAIILGLRFFPSAIEK